MICDRCDRDTEADLIRAYEDGAAERCSHCGLDLPEPSVDWLRANGYEIRAARLKLVAHIREQLLAGTYETEGKLRIAAEKLIDSLGRSTAQGTEDE